MTTNLRPTTEYLLRTPEGFIHNIDSEEAAQDIHPCGFMTEKTSNIKCHHGYQLLLNTRGPWIATFTGRRHYFLDPHPSEIVIEDIAHALSMICRYGGHCRTFYSVAEHSVRVAEAMLLGRFGDLNYVPIEVLFALLHDASEAYLGDLVHPLKVILKRPDPKNPHEIHYDPLPNYGRLEHRLEEIIYLKFTGTLPNAQVRDLIRYYDLALLKHEARALIRDAESQWEEWSDLPDEPDLAPIEPWSPSEARVRFMTAFAQCGGQTQP